MIVMEHLCPTCAIMRGLEDEHFHMNTYDPREFPGKPKFDKGKCSKRNCKSQLVRQVTQLVILQRIHCWKHSTIRAGRRSCCVLTAGLVMQSFKFAKKDMIMMRIGLMM
mmetsp:Transcript_6602/g.11767  ORF Transcript_6602/g.11767 Transcript_6602/m.11767 type:complete len:109 (+) Transcript_6602:233-559(+)